ncbi:protein translocase subunit SecF [Leptolyngbya sp. FACHB-261]|uniref:protein translocase subunit SecF n=1 Tax=Leptolyngbya sp. FACHB-261 TaxID=2692806 RepID=UPI001689E3B9|nr:protein translocase subunit SecF [Leptolyngbya sp. FACHB-261]MBD2100222.1 protein translocase subunit SecF [Leptolyngbya sp. FACHB-261]
MSIQVIKNRNIWWTVSAILTVLGLIANIVSWTQFGAPLRPGIDFTGGTRLQLELKCAQPGNCGDPIDITKVREVMEAEGYGSSIIQLTGSDNRGVLVRTPPLSLEKRQEVQQKLQQAVGEFDPAQSQIEVVGPLLGSQLLTQGLLALILSFAGIIVYLSLRFQFDYAFFAIVALLHDVLITTGLFAFLGLVFSKEVDSLFIVALLTIVGFSVNDTVVIYDRIRENLTLPSSTNKSFGQITDESVNQTLARSINTSLAATLPLIAIYFLGGPTLKDFALALILGFLCGAYSSIFIASTLVAWWRERQDGTPTASVGSEPSDQPAS